MHFFWGGGVNEELLPVLFFFVLLSLVLLFIFPLYFGRCLSGLLQITHKDFGS